MSRRTRAASKSKIMATTIASDVNKEAFDFASPKRKDCKLDVDSMPSVPNGRTKSVHTAAIANSKRNHKNAPKTKKSPQPITKYFSTSDHDTSANSLDGCTNDATNSITNGEVNGVEALKNGHEIPQSVSPAEETATVPVLNGSVLMSPEAKALQNGGKQTTPHRIVIRTSPKKQRIYAKDPVEVFSNLNIRDGSTKTAKKGKQKTRRKLNVTEVENQENGSTKSIEVVAEAVLNGESVPPVVKPAPTVKQASVKPILDDSANTSNNKDKVFHVPTNATQRRAQNTQLTDFFPIRRSNRKTKQAVEQEISQQIEMAIEKKLEDSLVVKVFPEKGRGIVAGRLFHRGEFVVEYIGELIDQTEADRREEAYMKNAEFGCYMYYFKHKEQQWCIDATAESGNLGRLVNHSRNGNLMTKIVSYKGKPHLVLLAKDDIKEGEELLYDYGDRRKESLIHHPWLAF